MTELLPGFAHRPVEVGPVRIHVRTAGSGPPVLLLHGYPQSMVMWHRVAPALAVEFTVVLADLRGYGASDKPTGGSPGTYAKRAMSADMLGVMTALGHHRFAVVGHDRGGRVAHRMALDAAERVSALAVLDIVPTLHMFTHVDRAMATSYFHWFFLTVGGGLPEALIDGDPRAWVRSRFRGRHAGGEGFDPAAMAEYERWFSDPRTVHATCEDYRAAATTDLELDREDHARGRRVTQPLLALAGASSYVGQTFPLAEVWSQYATDVTASTVAADHYLAEEAPGQTLAALQPFLAEAVR
jgi:haloacetate dehalogenase